MRLHLIPLLAPAVLAGCTAPNGQYPSLLPRAIESRGDNPSPVDAPSAKPNPELDRRIASLLGDLESAERGFAATVATAAPRIAAGRNAASGSESWIEAEAALARVDQARSPALSALTDLERMAIDEAAMNGADYASLDSAIATARAVVERQAERSRALQLAP